MTIRQLIRAASITMAAVLLMAASANATVTFNTTSSVFSGDGLSLPSLVVPGSATATLVFQTQPGASVNPPPTSNVNYGIFTLACPLCTKQGVPGVMGATFAPFDFNLTITETSPYAASGVFVGHSPGGQVYLDSSNITVTWNPLQLGPGANFGSTFFTTTLTTGIVNPTSGTNVGESTVQGAVGDNFIPEPATLGLIGSGLIGLGLLRRKRLPRP